MRLIDAAALAQEIESLKVTIGGRLATFDEAKSSVLRIIDDQKSVDAAEVLRGMWISVKDRLPDTDKKCIFYATGNEEAYIGKYAYTGKHGAVKFEKISGRGTVLYTASHWMPIPEPPEEDKL